MILEILQEMIFRLIIKHILVVKSLGELKNIYLDLIKILDARARKVPKFVEKIKMEERNKLIMKALKKAGLVRN